MMQARRWVGSVHPGPPRARARTAVGIHGRRLSAGHLWGNGSSLRGLSRDWRPLVGEPARVGETIARDSVSPSLGATSARAVGVSLAVAGAAVALLSGLSRDSLAAAHSRARSASGRHHSICDRKGHIPPARRCRLTVCRLSPAGQVRTVSRRLHSADGLRHPYVHPPRGIPRPPRSLYLKSLRASVSF